MHELQIKVQDLNRILANRQDQITKLKNQKEQNEKKIQNLQKTIFDLKTSLQKIQYEYKVTVEYLKTQNSTQKTEHLERIAFLEQESKKFRESYENLIKRAQQTYQFQIKSFYQSKDTYRLASQQIHKNLKSELNFHIQQYDLLKEQIQGEFIKGGESNQLFIKEKYQLQQRLRAKQIQFGFFLMKNESEIQAKNNHMNRMQKQIQEMLQNFQRQRLQLTQQKVTIQQVKLQRQKELEQRIQQIIQQRNQLETQLNNTRLFMNQKLHQNKILEYKTVEYSLKLEAVESEKNTAIQKLQQEIQKLKKDHQICMQTQTQTLKRTHQQKVAIFNIQIEQKDQEISSLKNKISSLKKQIEKKDLRLTQYEQKQRNYIRQNFQKKSQIENQKFYIQKIQKQNFILQQSLSKGNKQIKNKSVKNRFQQIYQESQKFDKFTGYISQNSSSEASQVMINRNQGDILIIEYPSSVMQEKKSQIKKQGSNLSKNLSKIPQSLSEFYEKSQSEYNKDVQQLKDTIHKQGQALLKNAQTIQKLQIQTLKIKTQKVQKQELIQQLQQLIKKQKIQHQKVRNQTIKSYTQLKEQSIYIQSRFQEQKNKYVVKIQKKQNQIEELNEKLSNLQKAYDILQTQNQNNLALNAKIKEIMNKKQENSTDKLNQIRIEKSQATQKVIENYKNLNNKIQKQNQNFSKQFGTLKSQNLQLLQSLKKNDQIISALQKKLQKKNKQFQELQKKLDLKNRELSLHQQRLNEYSGLVNSIQKQHLQSEEQKRILTEKLSKYDLYQMQLKQLKIFQIKQVEQILCMNHTMKVELQGKKMEVQYQIKLRKDIQAQILQSQKAYFELKNKFQQLQNINNHHKENKKQQQQNVLRIQSQYETKCRKMLEKIQFLQEQIQNKNEQLKKANRKLSQNQQLLKKDSSKIAQLSQEVNIYKMQIIQKHYDIQNKTKIIQKKQRQIITLREEIKELKLHKKSHHQQFLGPKQTQNRGYQTERLNTQNTGEKNPIDLMREWNNKMTKIVEEKKKIYNTLNDKQKNIVDELTKNYGTIFDLSTKGCLQQIQKLMNIISQLKEQKTKLINFMRSIMKENRAKSKKFNSMFEGFKEYYEEMKQLGQKFQYQNQKWETVTSEAFKAMGEQIQQGIKIRLNNQIYHVKLDSRYFKQKEQQKLQEKSSTSKLDQVIESVLSVEEETVKKQSRRQPASTTVQKALKNEKQKEKL